MSNERQEPSFEEQIARVCRALEAAGYDPINQLYGFVSTGNPSYVTRQDGARQIVVRLDKDRLKTYVDDEMTKHLSSTIEIAGRK